MAAWPEWNDGIEKIEIDGRHQLITAGVGI